MATKKSAGTTKNGRDSGPRYLGIKLYAGEKAKVGSIIVRQEGLNTIAGKNTGLGKDYTIYSLKEGIVEFSKKRKVGFNNKTKVKNIVHVK
ncbi:MAG: 50S ribosomal protein L27 [Candidatus Taylorbacteria bacterium CG10_big_fil_rev_8_21_14_0_10_41_48]|uniref:Large ribosomal subunit protein bL27 n=1 Tax=Candidatus Taylorbacteria bacterium CG10_big_fil_rev_8_21_14_0_10_41_48 TaxID=1975024 RepID=A0A2M8LCJ6_9BACT|nr:MAG: 50S ribosomal protein L27 [Candidatus Taylorbacteria bacterium CG10_big_fil_rev_8_21_14_0_10_41_48]